MQDKETKKREYNEKKDEEEDEDATLVKHIIASQVPHSAPTRRWQIWQRRKQTSGASFLCFGNNTWKPILPSPVIVNAPPHVIDPGRLGTSCG